MLRLLRLFPSLCVFPVFLTCSPWLYGFSLCFCDIVKFSGFCLFCFLPCCYLHFGFFEFWTSAVVTLVFVVQPAASVSVCLGPFLKNCDSCCHKIVVMCHMCSKKKQVDIESILWHKIAQKPIISVLCPPAGLPCQILVICLKRYFNKNMQHVNTICYTTYCYW